MFPSRRKQFSKITCPGGYQCALPFCIFNHDSDSDGDSNISLPKETKGDSGTKKIEKSVKIGSDLEEPPAKRIKQHLSETPSGSLKNTNGSAGVKSIQKSRQNTATTDTTKAKDGKAASNVFKNHNNSPSSDQNTGSQKQNKTSGSEKDTAMPHFSFTPRPLTGFAPATPQQRLVYLKALAKSLAGNARPDSTEYRRIQNQAVESEYKVALESSRQTYPANIRHKIAEASRKKKALTTTSS